MQRATSLAEDLPSEVLCSGSRTRLGDRLPGDPLFKEIQLPLTLKQGWKWPSALSSSSPACFSQSSLRGASEPSGDACWICLETKSNQVKNVDQRVLLGEKPQVSVRELYSVGFLCSEVFFCLLPGSQMRLPDTRSEEHRYCHHLKKSHLLWNVSCDFFFFNCAWKLLPQVGLRRIISPSTGAYSVLGAVGTDRQPLWDTDLSTHLIMVKSYPTTHSFTHSSRNI